MNTASLVNMRIVSESSPTRRLVIQKITDAIVQGRFGPGERLIERELCELMGVSRTSIREALRELENEGLIENIPNKGPIVARISVKQAESIYQVRAVTEGLAARLFAMRASPSQVKALEKAVEEIAVVYRDFSPARFLSAKDDFYSVLLEGADNEIAAIALKSIHVRVSQLRVFSLMRSGRADESLKELKRLLKCIKARDSAGAERECITHVMRAGEATLQMMREKELSTDRDTKLA
ncbi:MAG: GntR family transcriptional regulator [Pseudomonadota bacterium]